MEELDSAVEVVRGCVIREKSRCVYIHGIARYVLWLYKNKPAVVAPALRARLDSAEPPAETQEDASDTVRRFLSARPFRSPIDFALSTAHDFECFLVSLRKVDGAKPGKAVYGSMRSSLFHLYRECNVNMPVEFASELTLFFKGLKRTVARRGDNMKKGKEPIEFSLFQLLCRTMLHQPETEFLFAHTFLVLSWNLMCRAGNSVSIRWAHVQWHQDALAIRFAHMKNDQEGERREARHVYANPVMPHLCPSLSLSVYVATFGFDNSGLMFPGSNQYDRYTKILKRALALDPVRTALDAAGLEPADFGSHSARKGSATYVSSCSTAGPSASSICLRAGWSLPGVQDTYVRYEAAGDMIVDRFVAGLPFDSAKFATLPPFFPDPNDTVRKAAADVFPRAPASMVGTSVFFLASLVYHAGFLRETIPPSHPLFSSIIFRCPGLLTAFQAQVVTSCSQESGSIRPSGIPPHIGILAAMDNQAERLTELSTSLHDLVPQLGQQLEELMERRTVDSGLVTRSSVSAAVQEAVVATGLVRYLEATQSTPNRNDMPGVNDQRPPPIAEVQNDVPVFSYRGRLHRVPEDFVFPRTTVSVSWELWWFGNPAQILPPFRQLAPDDMPSGNTRKRLSDFRYLMYHIEAESRASGTFVRAPTLQQARTILQETANCLPVPPQTSRGRQRRVEQLLWSTVVNLLRKSRQVRDQGN